MTISSPVKGAFSGAEFAWREMSRRVRMRDAKAAFLCKLPDKPSSEKRKMENAIDRKITSKIGQFFTFSTITLPFKQIILLLQ
jgi:hypothetical protein